MIRLKNVSKFYYNKGIITSGFSKVNLELDVGEFVVITGESGSGKSTLLNVISGLDTYEEGEMYVNGRETSHYTERDFERYRKKYVGNIFQNFNLVYSYTVYQNIELILLINGYTKEEAKPKVIDIINKVGLEEFADTKASKLSGGQKQRVAIARALAKETDIIVADEPTGNLDSESASAVIKILGEISKDKLVIVVTHNYDQFEEYATRRIKMNDGRISDDETFSKPRISAEKAARLTKERSEDKAIDEAEKEDFGKQININSKLRLGVRNAFNIAPKFILLLVVFMFLIFSVASEYGTMKKNEAELYSSGSNRYFSDCSDERIVVNRDDKGAMTRTDYNTIKSLPGVKKVEKNDMLLDMQFWASGSDIASDVRLKSNDNIPAIRYGEKAKAANEAVIEVGSDNWYFGSESRARSVLGSSIELQDYNTGVVDPNFKDIKIVGVIINDDMGAWDSNLYVSDTMLQVAKNYAVKNASTITAKTDAGDIDISAGEMSIVSSSKVPKGSIYASENINGFFKNGTALDKDITLELKNIYTDNSVTLEVGNLLNSRNIKSILGIDDFESNTNTIFINPDDMTKLAEKSDYQYSVYVDGTNDIDSVLNALNERSYAPLSLQGAVKVNQISEAMFNIVQVPVILFMIITMFFIAYFVIKLILRSRSDYFVILRILGMNSKNSKRMLDIELLVVAHGAFLIFLCVYALIKSGIIGNQFLTSVVAMLGAPELIVLYLVIMIMVYLISTKFAKSIFKESTMKTFREEA